MADRILVVDDEQEVADLLELYLVNEGYQVHKFYQGKDAAECVAHSEIDLALLDVMLPDVDGFQLCKDIRKNYFFPIIMLTARVEDVDKIQGLMLGADDYITKPFNPLEVVARIKTHLRRYRHYNRGESSAPLQDPAAEAQPRPQDELIEKYCLIRGGIGDLPQSKRKQVLGLREYPGGFDAMIEMKDIAGFPGSVITETVSLDDIMVRMSKEVEE